MSRKSLPVVTVVWSYSIEDATSPLGISRLRQCLRGAEAPADREECQSSHSPRVTVLRHREGKGLEIKTLRCVCEVNLC